MAAGSKQVQYIGPHDAVELVREERFGGDGSVVTAVRGGEPVTVPAEHADALLEQVTNWRVPEDAGKAAAKQKGGEA